MNTAEANKAIEFQILGLGAWGLGFRTWSDLADIFAGEKPQDDGSKGPKPEIIPANERRRAPLPVRLAVESSWQAVQHADVDPAELASVFVSGLGDTQLTDYMCRALVAPNKALSPTKFHNSVHNAAAGYWTISTGCMQAANSVAGFQQSVPLTLMEALIQSQIEQRPVLITFYDAPCSDVLHDLLKNEVSFATSVIVAPPNTTSSLPNYQAQVIQEAVEWPDFTADKVLQNIYTSNPSGRVLPILKAIALDNVASKSLQEPLKMPLSAQTSFQLSI